MITEAMARKVFKFDLILEWILHRISNGILGGLVLKRLDASRAGPTHIVSLITRWSRPKYHPNCLDGGQAFHRISRAFL